MNFDSSSEFFDSEMVQASLEDIKELQDLITNSINIKKYKQTLKEIVVK